MSAEDVTVAKPPTIGAALAKKRRSPEAVVEHITEGDDLIIDMANSEPATVLDAIEAHAERLSRVRIHQMLPFRERRYMHGHLPGLRGRLPRSVRVRVARQRVLVLLWRPAGLRARGYLRRTWPVVHRAALDDRG